MKNIHILQTKEPTRIFETNTGLQFSIIDKVRVGEYKGFHIYITSDEEIKEGDWTLMFDDFGNLFLCDKPQQYLGIEKGHHLNKGLRKIILTTDHSLDGVQTIDDMFLEWFFKNPTCEFVEVNTYTNKIGVEYDANGYREMDVFGKEYRIKIPQEEQKQHLINMMRCDEELGGYEEPKQDLLPDFKLSKDIFDNLSNLSSKELLQEFSKLVDENFDELIGEEPKRETLEEAAECKSHHSEEDFIRGAKWQAERMYSEADMIEFSEWVSLNFPNQHNYLRALQKYNQGLDVPKERLVGYRSTKELLEQFKKK